MKVKINTHGNALPEVHGEWIDLCTAEDVTLDFLEYKIISLGVSIEIPAGYYAHIVPRSSTFGKWGILLANSMGVIENDYCGDGDVWGYPALCLRKEGTRSPKGTRICQFRLVEKAPDMEFVQVESLGNRDRGGFGSTGEQVHTGGTAERNKPERNSRVERKPNCMPESVNDRCTRSHGAGRKRVYPKTDFGTMLYMTFDRFMTRDFGVPFANIIAKIDAGLLSSGEPKQP